MWKKIKTRAIAVWTFLDNKKTAIGTACLITANYIPRDKTAYYILSIAGELLGGVGITHKLIKADKQPSGLSKTIVISKSVLNKIKNMNG